MVWAKGRKLQDGKYVIEKELDQGGFGITYLVKRDDGQRFVVKILNDDMQKSSNFSKYQQNFVNEALRLARCSHPHIVRVEELIQERNLWGIVMEYVEGETLADLVKREGLISQDQALRYIKQVGDALVAVHQNGFLHRDVKPQNIMVRASCDEAVLIDFGIAREFEQDKTQSHTQFLSRYFAPIEQYDKRAKRGAYTDVYALAGTLYYLVTGEYPIAAPNRAVGMELELPSEYNSDLDDWLEGAILKGLEIKPSDRPQSIQDWLDLLIASRNNQECQKLLNIAEELGRNDDLEEALVYYKKAFQLQPNSYDVCVKFGAFLKRLDEYEEAIVFYDRAIQINPDTDESWCERGRIQLWYLNKIEEAIYSFDHAIKINPDISSTWIYRGCALEELGRNKEALDAYNYAIQIRPDIELTWKYKGDVLKKLGKKEEAIDAYNHYLKLDSNRCPYTTSQAWYERGSLLWEIGKEEEAIESYDRALELCSDDENLWFDKGFALWFDRGFALWMLDRNEAAISDFDQALQIDDQNHRAWHYRGRAMADMGQYKLATESYDKALKLEPSYYKVWYYSAISLYKLGESKKALTSINKAIKANSKDRHYWNYKGIILDDLKRHSKAVDCYDRSLRISSSPVVWCNRAMALKNSGDYFEAIISCKKCLKIKEDYDPALELYESLTGLEFEICSSSLYENTLDKDLELHELIELYENALEVDPNSHDVWHYRGRAMAQLEYYSEAIESYCKALDISYRSYRTWYYLAIALNENEDYFEACQCCIESLIINEHYEPALEFFKIILNQNQVSLNSLDYYLELDCVLGGYELDMYSKSLNELDYYINIANILFKTERYQEAIYFYESAIDISFSDLLYECITYCCEMHNWLRNDYLEIEEIVREDNLIRSDIEEHYSRADPAFEYEGYYGYEKIDQSDIDKADIYENYFDQLAYQFELDEFDEVEDLSEFEIYELMEIKSDHT